MVQTQVARYLLIYAIYLPFIYLPSFVKKYKKKHGEKKMWRYRSQPSIRPDIPSGVPRALNPGHSRGEPESKPLKLISFPTMY